MSNASYSVVRYVPDPGRGESLNIGILLWDEDSYRFSVDEKAVERVIRENPLLERDALLYVEPVLSEQLSTAVVPVAARIKSMLGGQRGFPIQLSDARFTMLDEDGGMDATIERLTNRIVTPKRRTGGHTPRPVDLLERRLTPLLRSEAISRNHFFNHSRTGVPRKADFFANSGANVALDVVKLAITRADEIRLRSDAEAFKVYDVLEADDNDVNDYFVFCEFAENQELEETNHNARTVIEQQGATVVTSLDAATSVLEVAARRSG